MLGLCTNLKQSVQQQADRIIDYNSTTLKDQPLEYRPHSIPCLNAEYLFNTQEIQNNTVLFVA